MLIQQLGNLLQNASQLTTKRVFTTAGDVSATPTVERGSVYVPDWGGYIYRIDANIAKAIWSHKVAEYTGEANSFSRTNPAVDPSQIIFSDQAGGTLISIDKALRQAALEDNCRDSSGSNCYRLASDLQQGRVCGWSPRFRKLWLHAFQGLRLISNEVWFTRPRNRQVATAKLYSAAGLYQGSGLEHHACY